MTYTSPALGMIMDPIETINIHKDSSFAILLEAQRRNYTIYYMLMQDLFIDNGIVSAHTTQITVQEDATHWFTRVKPHTLALSDLDVLWMRKDPPVDINYIYATHLLDLAKTQGAQVINDPQALRDANEKLLIYAFPNCIPPTQVSSHIPTLKEFILSQKAVVVKPLDGKGGEGVMRLNYNDPNINAILALLTHSGQRLIMAQRFIPEITQGDKRILLIDGMPYPHTLLRIPNPNDWRGNLVAGASHTVQPLTERDRWICSQVGPVLRQKGLFFVGIDVIGDYLTEINVTSPTCIREIEAACQSNIAGQLFDQLNQRT